MKYSQITTSMAKDIAFKLGAVLNDEEATIFADGYNVALLKVNKDMSTALSNNASLSTNSPVIPEEMPKGLAGQIVSLLAHNIGDKFLAQKIWNACRAAMLQGAEAVSNRDELPLDYLQGHKDGLEWAAQLAEANHPQTGDWLYDDPIELARAIRKGPDMPTVQAGNSQVIPDGWINCSERMPAQDDWVLIYSKYGEYLAGQVQGKYVELNDGTLSWLGAALHWMPLPAAPQQEVIGIDLANGKDASVEVVIENGKVISHG